MRKSALVFAAIALVALVSSWAITRDANPLRTLTGRPSSTATRRPQLRPVSSDVQAERQKDQIITEPGGAERHSHQFYLIVDRRFETARLLDFSPNVQLVDERVIPDTQIRSILARVPEDELPGVIDALSKEPGVETAALNYILRPN